MPYRKQILASDQIYHSFNRSIASQNIFLTNKDYQRAINLINFYQKPAALRFSHFLNLKKEIRNKFQEQQAEKSPLVQILAFCLMPNHIHFLLKQNVEKGISEFMKKFQQSYAKYFNLKNQRSGSLFQSMFKAVRIETDEQLLHVSRYIHLNPVSSFLVNKEEIKKYPWSSLQDYIGEKTHQFVEPDLILANFGSREKYGEFVTDQINYQQELEKIKHIALD